MRPFITSFGMICTGATYHLHDRWEGVTALFAGVIGFLSAFIELVAVSVAAVGMAGSRWQWEVAGHLRSGDRSFHSNSLTLALGLG